MCNGTDVQYIASADGYLVWNIWTQIYASEYKSEN